MPPVVIGAVNLGPTSPRVLLHAAGFAAALGAGLKVLHVAANITADTQATVAAECLRMAPYQAMFEESDVLVRLGPARPPSCSCRPTILTSSTASMASS